MSYENTTLFVSSTCSRVVVSAGRIVLDVGLLRRSMNQERTAREGNIASPQSLKGLLSQALSRQNIRQYCSRALGTAEVNQGSLHISRASLRCLFHF